MKTTGISFSLAMVRALIRQRSPKTQTRRLVRAAPQVHGSTWSWLCVKERRYVSGDTVQQFAIQLAKCCPYGARGDRLYVREPWRTEARYDHLRPTELPSNARIWFEADGEPRHCLAGRYRHARFMPQNVARIWLSITEVRAHRIQDILEREALEEGAKRVPTGDIAYSHDTDACNEVYPTAAASFKAIWGAINGPASWGENPWVFAITFRRIK